MIRAATRIFTLMAQRYLPDAYVFALVLTIGVFGASILLKGHSFLETTTFWGDGFWNLLSFSMQMTLVLVTGFALAKTKALGALLSRLAKLPKNQNQAVLLVTLGSCFACYINWGFGLVVSALLAVEVAKELKRINYGLLIASAYSGFLVWHGGLSGSVPLKLTDPNLQIQNLMSRSSIGLDESIFSFFNLKLTFITVAGLALINFLMSRLGGEKEVGPLELYEDKQEDQKNNDSFASKLEGSALLGTGLGLLFIIYSINRMLSNLSVDLNFVIFLFLGIGTLLHLRPNSYLSAFKESLGGASGIILQFPFYAGIMGVMNDSGLAEDMSNFFVSISNERTFYFFSYLSAGVVNFFVPSGGGQWVIQGPIILEAAQSFGNAIDPVKASMAIAWGDAWTNMIQPFWALPLLAAGKCPLRDMMGYSAVIFFVIGLIQGLVFLFI